MSKGEMQKLIFNLIHGCCFNPTWIAPYWGWICIPLTGGRIALNASLRHIIGMECREAARKKKECSLFYPCVERTPILITSGYKGAAPTPFWITLPSQFSKHTHTQLTGTALLAMLGSYPANCRNSQTQLPKILNCFRQSGSPNLMLAFETGICPCLFGRA